MGSKELAFYIDLGFNFCLNFPIFGLNPLSLYANICFRLLLSLNAPILSGNNISLFVGIAIILEFHLHFITRYLLFHYFFLQLLDGSLHFVGLLLFLAEFLLELDQS